MGVANSRLPIYSKVVYSICEKYIFATRVWSFDWACSHHAAEVGTLKAHRTPTNRRYYVHDQYLAYIGQKAADEKSVAYCRVSSAGQKKDLDSQRLGVEQFCIAAGKSIGESLEDVGRVENRLSPALPHQTVHAVFPHTAFRCSSHLGMRRFPARYCWNFIQPITPIQINTGESTFADSSVFDLVAPHQVRAHSLFRMGFNLLHHLR